jgi:predicted DNA-binding transcriptional regulator AlpA
VAIASVLIKRQMAPTLEFDIDTDKLMKVSDILAMLAKVNAPVSRPAFDRWVKTGYFPAYTVKIGASLRWTERTVKAWLQRCVNDAKK